MNVIIGSSYPLALALTRNGRPAELPAGATVSWTLTDDTLGSISTNVGDPLNATLNVSPDIEAGVEAKVRATVTCDDPVLDLEIDSETLTSADGVPDGGTITVGAEMP